MSQAVLGTVVVSKNAVIPLPVECARAMLKEAALLAEKAARTEEESNRLTGMLKEAKTEIEMAELLGYGRRKKDFKEIYAQLKAVEKKVASEKPGKGFFDEIVASFHSLFDHKTEEKAGKPESETDIREGSVEESEKSTKSSSS